MVTSICLGEILVNDLFKTVSYDECWQAKEFYVIISIEINYMEFRLPLSYMKILPI